MAPRIARRGLVLAMLAGAGLGHAPRVRAQMLFDGPAYAFPVANMAGPMLVGMSMNAYTARSRGNGGKGRVPAADAGPQSLLVGRDSRISAQTKESFRQQLLRAHPDRRADIDAALRRDWLRGYAEEIARPNGLDPRNLADAVTAYSVAGWAIVHQQDRIAPQAIRSVRDTLRVQMADEPKVARLSAAERQRMAESLMLHTVLIMAQRTEAQRTRNTALAQASAAHYRAALREGMQVDMAQLALSDEGFVQR